MSLEQFGYKQELKRTLTLSDLVIYGMVFMVPIAPFGVFGWIYQDTHGMVPLAYLIGMVGMLFTALSYSAMSKEFPIAGSVYSYAQRGISEHVGFIAGWAILLDYLLIPALVYVFSAIAMHELFPAVERWQWLIFFLVTATVVNLKGISFTAKMNIVFLIGELVVFAIFVAVGLYALYQGQGNGELTLAPLYQPDVFSVGLVMKAVSIAALSFLGFDAISTLAEEVKGDPAKQIGRAALITLFVMGIIFMAQTWIAVDLAAGLTFSSPDTIFYQIAQAAGGEWLGIVTGLATALAWGIATSVVSQGAVSRVLFSMGRDQKLPKVLSKVHAKWGTPYISILFVAVLSLFLGLYFLEEADLLTSLVSFGALTGFLFLHLSVIIHFIIRNGSKNYLRYLICPAIGFFIIGYILISMSEQAIILGGIWFVIGLIYLIIMTKMKLSLALSIE
ncbi:APC family permease [Orbus sasakiae]|uniref:APC family permease n=1 Tax=Orbus sasakiae TaxID=1078475 RepID=A0ABP9N3P9_9GAMM